MLTHIVRHIFLTTIPTSVKLGIRVEDDESTTHVSHKRHGLKGQGRKVT